MPASIIIDGNRTSNNAITISNKSFRYGDGFFETMKWADGRLLLADDHLNRFFSTAGALGYSIPAPLTRERLLSEISLLTNTNHCEKLARIRLTAWRGEGGLLEGDDTLHYSIECQPLDETAQHWNKNGLVIGIYQDAHKSTDGFSSFKTSNFHPYNLAARTAQSRKWDDAIILNNSGRVADSCIANIFIIRKTKIFTPPLAEGPVAGIMRRQLLQHFDISETPLTIEDLENADEIFLSNAIRGLRWVRQLGERFYDSSKSRRIYGQLLQTI